MAKKPNQKQNASTQGAMEGNVEQIREILFGGQMRDYEQRFNDLEKRLTKNFDRLSADFDKRLERVNAYAKREIDKLTEQFRSERKERMADNKQGLKELQDLTNQVEAWFAEVDDQFDVESKELRAALQEQSEELATMIDEARSSADAKLDSEDLAHLLGEVARQLKRGAKPSRG